MKFRRNILSIKDQIKQEIHYEISCKPVTADFHRVKLELKNNGEGQRVAKT